MFAFVFFCSAAVGLLFHIWDGADTPSHLNLPARANTTTSSPTMEVTPRLRSRKSDTFLACVAVRLRPQDCARFTLYGATVSGVSREGEAPNTFVAHEPEQCAVAWLYLKNSGRGKNVHKGVPRQMQLVPSPQCAVPNMHSAPKVLQFCGPSASSHQLWPTAQPTRPRPQRQHSPNSPRFWG